MTERNATFSDELDRMLEEGRISEEEYETLRQAADAAPVERERSRSGSDRRLAKTHDGRQLAGVCAGIAKYLGMPASRVRLFFVLAFLFTGGTAFLVYVALMLALPWEEGAHAQPIEKARHFWPLLALLALAGTLHHAWMGPAKALLQNVGFEIPRYLQILIRVDAFLYSPGGLVLQVLVFLGLGGAYILVRREPGLQRTLRALVGGMLIVVAAACLGSVLSFHSVIP